MCMYFVSKAGTGRHLIQAPFQNYSWPCLSHKGVLKEKWDNLMENIKNSLKQRKGINVKGNSTHNYFSKKNVMYCTCKELYEF